MQNAYLSGIGDSIRIGREIRCLPYAGFLKIYIHIFHAGYEHIFGQLQSCTFKDLINFFFLVGGEPKEVR